MSVVQKLIKIIYTQDMLGYIFALCVDLFDNVLTCLEVRFIL